jgi:predicted nucleotidyltransferase
VPPTTLQAAVRALVDAAQPGQVILFGSRARGDAREDADLDRLVIESRVEDRVREVVRLRRALRPPRSATDVRVYSREDVQRSGNRPGSALYRALREGLVTYGED